jgi:ABC-type sugar transport system ATPase subunit
MSFLSVSGIYKEQYGDLILKDVSFAQQKLQKIAIAGETGSGKSTLLKIIAGLIQPTAGVVQFELSRVKGPEEKLVPGHPHIGYLSQHFELRNNYTVEEELKYTNILSDEEAAIIYEICRISHLLKRKTNQLSGGERQRIVMARLLVAAPKLLLLDEPFSNLDRVHKQVMKSVINDIGTKLNITCLLISHDPIDILSWADEVLIMKDGKILQQGTPEQVYRQPVDAYTAGLLGNYNLIRGEQGKVFSPFVSASMDGKNMLVRPEHFKIVPERDGTIKGKVQKVIFYGNFYELEVLLSEGIIIVATDANNIAEGDPVHLALSPEDVWYVAR